METFDLVILGSGQAAVPLAGALTSAGWRVAIIERESVGGSCINFGCTPSKAAIMAGRVAHLARRAGDYGIDVGPIRPNFAKVMGRVRKISADFRDSSQKNVDGMDKLTFIKGTGRIDGWTPADDAGDRQIRLRITSDENNRSAGGEHVITAKKLVLDTGTRSVIPKIEGLEKIEYIDAQNWVALDTLPTRLLMLGGGYIGSELAQFYRRMGSEVVVIDGGEQILGHEDKDVAEAVQDALAGEGIEYLLNTHAKGVVQDGDSIVLTLEDGSTQAGSHLFIAVGRKPNTDNIGLESIGIEPDDEGIIKIDDRCRTTVPGVLAVGDIRGGPMFTHMAWDDHRILEGLLLGDGDHSTERVVPYGVFTDPELGRVGLTEQAARHAGHDVNVISFDMKSNAKAVEIGETAGLVKLVVDRKNDQLLGAAVLGAHGAELVGSLITLMNAKAPLSAVRKAIYVHPTLTQAIQSAAIKMTET